MWFTSNWLCLLRCCPFTSELEDGATSVSLYENTQSTISIHRLFQRSNSSITKRRLATQHLTDDYLCTLTTVLALGAQSYLISSNKYTSSSWLSLSLTERCFEQDKPWS